MRKELAISAKLNFEADQASLDKISESMRKKLQESYAPADQIRTLQTSQRLQQAGYGGLAGAPTAEGVTKNVNEYKRTLDLLARQEKTALEEKVRNTAKYQTIVDNILKSEKTTLNTALELNKAQKALAQAKEEQIQKDLRLNTILTERKRVNEYQDRGGPNAPPPNAAGQGGKGMSLSKALGGVLTAIATGAAVIDQYTSIPIARSLATGNATQSLIGGQLQNARGDFISQGAFLPERQKALQMANEKMKYSEGLSHTLGMTGVGAGLAALGGNTKPYNAMMGDISGTLADRIPNSFIGGMPGAKGVAGWLGQKSEGYQSALQSQLMEEHGGNVDALYEAEKKKNPLKNLAATDFQQNYMQDLQTQRTLGLGYAGFHGKGGFKENANMSGFNADLATQMSGQILGAGGSTRGAQSGSVLGLQAQRGFDMTNAGSVLGKISGGAGGGAASEAVFKKLLTESVKAGLDSSEYREEQRKFADITSEVLSRSGVKSAEDAGRVLEGFSRMVGREPTMRELAGAQAAYEEQQGFSAETGGRGGALQFAGLMKQEGMTKLGAAGMAGLMEMPEADLTSDNPFIIAKAAQAGMTPKELIGKTLKAKREKGQIEVGLDPEKMQALQAYMSKNNLDVGTMTAEQIQGMPEDLQRSFQAATDAATYKSGYAGQQKRTAVTRGLIGGATGGGAEEYGPGTSIEERLRAPGTRPEDAAVAQSGKVAQVFLENFREFKDVITPASTALDDFTRKMVLFATALNLIPDKDKPAAQKYMAERMAEPKVQPQGSKPAPGR